MVVRKMMWILAAFSLVPAASMAAPPGDTFGIWRNPKNSVHVKAHQCGTSMCGTVVWASEKAIADAKKGSSENLVGMQLFSGFTRDAKGRWRGKVFVPDIAKTFSGELTPISPTEVKGRGCLVGRVACKSQVWTRLE